MDLMTAVKDMDLFEVIILTALLNGMTREEVMRCIESTPSD